MRIDHGGDPTLSFVNLPIVCLVTDRKRLGDGSGVESLLALVAAASQAGVDLVQIRETDLPSRDLLALSKRAVALTSGTATRIIINDRVDIAVAAGAAGVHLRADSIDAARVRVAAPPEFIVGRSVHSATEAMAVSARGGLDYITLGTIFASKSKSAGALLAGLGELARAARSISVPIVGIGGIDFSNLAQIANTGAAGFAAIGLFSEVPEAASHVARIERIVREAKRVFDTP